MIVHALAATRLDVAGAATALIDVAPIAPKAPKSPKSPADPVTVSLVPGDNDFGWGHRSSLKLLLFQALTELRGPV
jgi:hypothetical protein